MSRFGRVLQVVLIGLMLLAIAGVFIPLITKARVNSERINCENHLKDIGLNGMRHASLPGQGIPDKIRDELPAGTIVSPKIPIDQRLSWYVNILNVLDAGGPPAIEPKAETKKRRSPRGLSEAVQMLELDKPWDSANNSTVAKHRLIAAICPGRTADLSDDTPQLNYYLANGGIGIDTPALTRDRAGKNAGAFRYDQPTPLEAFTDGLSQTFQFVETSRNNSPWLRGGAATLRALDEADKPYIGIGRQFGGCHPGGAYASRADGSVMFVRDSIDSAVFRAMFTIAGGREEQPFDAP